MLTMILAMTLAGQDVPKAEKAKAAEEADPKQEMVCKRVKHTHTRVPGKKVCDTRENWDRLAERAQGDMTGANGGRGIPPSSEGIDYEPPGRVR